MTNRLELKGVFDAHLHLRQGDLLRKVAPFTERWASRCILMPNTEPPIDTPGRLTAYQEEVRGPLSKCEPLFTFKLAYATTPEDVASFRKLGCVAAKLYPEGVTTNSQGTGLLAEFFTRPYSLGKMGDTLQALADAGMVLCIHGELPGACCLDAEVRFLDWLLFLLRCVPELRVVLEHVSSREAVGVLRQQYGKSNLAATVTAHHLWLTVDDVVGNPWNHCKPVCKRPEDRDALRRAVFEGHPAFFFGSDSAPHAGKFCQYEDDGSVTACKAGVFSAPCAVESLATLFDQNNALDELQGFLIERGEAFYGLPPRPRPVVLERRPYTVPPPGDGLVSFLMNTTLPWSLYEAT